jgi:LysM repeat protein
MSDLTELAEFREFNVQLLRYITKHAYRAFFRFEAGKDIVAGALYHKRGKYARPFLHSGMMALIFFGIILGPKFIENSLVEAAVREESVAGESSLGVSLDSTGIVTLESEKPWNQVSEYSVKEGDTLSTIAAKFELSIESVKWANPSINWQKVKPGVLVSIPPVTGVVYKVKPEDVTADMRRQAKVFNFGTMYGMGSFGLAQAVQIDQKVAAEFIAAYFKKFAGVAKFIEEMKEGAREKGYVETELGRRRYTPEITSQNAQVARSAERMAINMPIQGLAADIMKLAMLEAQRLAHSYGEDAKMVLQIHDELIFEVKEARAQEFSSAIRQSMGKAYPLRVPLIAEVLIGKHWGEI